MDISWDDLRLFLAVAETGSLSAAARQLRLGQPTVSRRLAALEEQLQTPLFRRSVEGATPTRAGLDLLAPARNMAEWAAEVEIAAERGEAKLEGVVRVTAAPGVAFDFLAPFAAVVKERLPEVRLEVVSAVQYLDLSRREADLALRMRDPGQRDLVRVQSIRFENGAFAAPEYVERLPRGYGLSDVDWIAWAPPLDRVTPNPELEAMVPGFRPVFAADDFLVQLRAARAGVGAVFLGAVYHRFSVISELRRLKLDLGPHSEGALHLVAAKSTLAIPRVRAVADLLAAELAEARTRCPSAEP